ncbi:MAG: hypothetical protein IID40_04315 [Planctomycetes bacterium]|nr:hypothetical protein [Planctomycetota bacterium]
MRSITFLSLLLVALGMVGCSQNGSIRLHPPPGKAALLFDRQAGWPRATQMAVRHPWPAAQAYNRAGEEILFQERIIDFQGLGSHGNPHDRFYRRAETRRVIRAHR